MRDITVHHTGFHGENTVRFRGKADANGLVEVSAGVARRLNKEVCGVGECRCGEAIAEQVDWGRWVVRTEGKSVVEINGYYR